MARHLTLMLSALLVGAFAVGCDDEDETPADPALEAPAAPEQTATQRTFSIDRDSTELDFVMMAPLENIHGVANDSMEGDLYVDLADITQSRGLVKIDLDRLEIFQQKREDENAAFGEEVKNETQNEHTRTWFQISEDAPDDVRQANRWVQFNVTRIDGASQTNILEMEGDERTINATIHGDFHLHGHTTQKTATVEIAFTFEGDEPRSMRITTTAPISVGLAEHDVRPRSAFGTLAQATLSSLGQKVAEAAPINFEVVANAGAPLETMPPCAIATSEAASAACGLGIDEPPGEGGIPPEE